MYSPMGIQGMKAHHFARGLWEHEPAPTSLALGCKRLRPLAPKLTSATTTTLNAFDIKSFIRPDSGPRKHGSSDYQKKESAQVEAQPGGTRWNPTQEQIALLEMLYKGGVRTPNAQQIEQITSQLAKYGKIEGKNVFYWFQNHKARERQKQKRNSLGSSNSPKTPPSPFSSTSNTITTTTTNACLLLSATKGDGVEEELHGTPYKRKCRSWAVDQCPDEDGKYCTEEEGEDRTLKLFPLHPEGKC